MSKFKRKKLWIDSKVQGALLVRVLAYWISCLVTVALLSSVMNSLARMFPGMSDQPFFAFMPAIVASACFLPLVVRDTLKMSNRFVGPMFRLRRSVAQLANGEPVKKVYFRDGDMWQDFADEFNKLVTRLDMEKMDRDENHQKAETSKAENVESPGVNVSDVNVSASDAKPTAVPLGVPSTTALPLSSEAATV